MQIRISNKWNANHAWLLHPRNESKRWATEKIEVLYIMERHLDIVHVDADLWAQFTHGESIDSQNIEDDSQNIGDDSHSIGAEIGTEIIPIDDKGNGDLENRDEMAAAQGSSGSACAVRVHTFSITLSNLYVLPV